MYNLSLSIQNLYDRYASITIQIMKPKKPIELDGRTGEGGGQLVRISVALAAVTSQPIRITHVRGKRSGGRGGGKFSNRRNIRSYLYNTLSKQTMAVTIIHFREKTNYIFASQENL